MCEWLQVGVAWVMCTLSKVFAELLLQFRVLHFAQWHFPSRFRDSNWCPLVRWKPLWLSCYKRQLRQSAGRWLSNSGWAQIMCTRLDAELSIWSRDWIILNGEFLLGYDYCWVTEAHLSLSALGHWFVLDKQNCPWFNQGKAFLL